MRSLLKRSLHPNLRPIVFTVTSIDMKPIIIKSDKFLDSVSWFFKVGGITLFPFIIVREKTNKTTIKHESIHIAQYIELFVIGFLVLYLWDWVRGLIKYKDTNVAYRKIRLEQEAYEYQRSFTYLDKRERFAWKKYKV